MITESVEEVRNGGTGRGKRRDISGGEIAESVIVIV
jgi:hypothetical protein